MLDFRLLNCVVSSSFSLSMVCWTFLTAAFSASVTTPSVARLLTVVSRSLRDLLRSYALWFALFSAATTGVEWLTEPSP